MLCDYVLIFPNNSKKGKELQWLEKQIRINEQKKWNKIVSDVCLPLLCRISSGIGPVPQLLSNQLLELLDGDFSLESPAYAGAPVFLEALHLGLYVVLARRARGVDEFNVAFGVGEVALDAAELMLEVVVCEEPGVAAVGVEELEVLGAGGEVGGGDEGV